MPAEDAHKAEAASSELLERVRMKRADVERYLESNSRRQRSLVNTALIAGIFAAFLTAPPAIGGKPFADWLQKVFHSASPSWQLLCLFATLSSLTAATVIQLQKSHNYEERIARAQVLLTDLEALDISMTSEGLTSRKATNEFLKCVNYGSFMEPPRRRARLGRRRADIYREHAPPTTQG